METELLGRECVRAVYCLSPDKKSDMLFIKEKLHYADRIEDNTVQIENFKRNFWVTKPGYQNHKDQKEWELLSRLDKFTCTQAQLPMRVAQALGVHTSNPNMRMMCNSPFLYGSDITTTSIIKQLYTKKWPKAVSPKLGVAALDTETCMKTKKLIILSFAYKNKLHLFITKKFLEGVINPIEKLNDAFNLYLGDRLGAKGITFHPEIVETPAVAVCRAMDLAHEYKPDFISMWNQNYDVPHMVETLEEEGFDPALIFSDPSVPHRFKFFDYKEGPTTRTKADGTVTSLKPWERWHKPRFPASFFFVSADAVYYDLRKQKGLEANYKLDGVLERNIGNRKLNIEAAGNLSGEHWHIFMQENHKIAYCIYGGYDSSGLLELDEKTGDLSQMFGILNEITDNENFKSNPRKIIDDLHFFCMENDHVIGTTPSNMVHELDKYCVDKKGWIVTLPAYMLADEGLNIFDHPSFKSMLFIHCADSDVEGTYPSLQERGNISKETTEAEMVSIEGMDEEQRRVWGINYLGGEVNAIELAVTGFGAPSPDEWVQRYREAKGLPH